MVQLSKHAWPLVFPHAFLRRFIWGDGTDVTTGVVGYGTGNSTFTVAGTNTFTSAGTFNPVVTITDTAAGSATATATAAANVTGVLATAAGPVAATQGVAMNNVPLATFVNTTHHTSGHYTASVDWLGDGSSDPPGVTQPVVITSDGAGNYTVKRDITNTTFLAAGTFYPLITITDTDDGTTATATAEVDVAGITVTALPISDLRGSQFSGNVATFTDTAADADPTGDSYTATILWGDGNVATGVITADTNGAGGFTVSGSDTYPTAGTPTVTVTITDTADNRSSASSGTAANVTTLIASPVPNGLKGT